MLGVLLSLAGLAHAAVAINSQASSLFTNPASSLTLTGTGSDKYALTVASGVHVLAGKVKLESGAFIQWGDGSVSSAAAGASGGGEGSAYNGAGVSKTFLVPVAIHVDTMTSLFVGTTLSTPAYEVGAVVVSSQNGATYRILQIHGRDQVGTVGAIFMTGFNNSGPNVVWRMRSAGGTPTAPTPTLPSWQLLQLTGQGLNQSGTWRDSASILYSVDASTGLAGGIPGVIRFLTTNITGTGAVERCRVSSSGTFQCGYAGEAPLATRLYLVDTTVGSTGPFRAEGANGAIFQMNGAGQLELASSAWVQPQVFLSSITSQGGLSVSTSATANPALATDSNGVVRVSAGGLSTATVGGRILHVNYTMAVTTTNAGTYEISFATLTLPAGTLKTNGDCIRVNIGTLPRGAVCVGKVRFGASATLVYSRNMAVLAPTSEGVTICRSGSNTQMYGGESGNATGGNGVDLTETDANALPIQLAGSSSVVGGCSFTFGNVYHDPAP